MLYSCLPLTLYYPANRLVIFNANSFHMSMDYFGHDKETGRLFQVFFFSTEKQIC